MTSPRMRGSVDRVLAIGEGGAHVEELEDLLQGRHPGLVGRVELRELLDRFEQVRERRYECDDRAGRDVAFDRLQAAVHDDHRHREPGEHFHAREVRGVQLHRDVFASWLSRVERGEPVFMGPLLGEAAHDAHTREALLEVAGDRSDRVARAPEGAGRDDAEPQRAGEQQRQDEEGQQRELDVEVDQDPDGADQGQPGLEQRDDGIGDEAVERLDVVGDARDQHPGGAALVEADRQRLQVLEDLHPQVGERALADPADEVGLQVGHQPHQQRRDQEGDHDHEQALSSRPVRCLCRSRRGRAGAVRASPRCR